MSAPGRLLGVDYGKVRVGLAVTDPERRIASPLETYARRSAEHDARYFLALARAEEIAGLVIGLPVHNDGREGEQAEAARVFGAWLTGITGLTAAFWDERFTTQEAEAFLSSARLTHKKRKARRDCVAAQIMLQSYLESGTPQGKSP